MVSEVGTKVFTFTSPAVIAGAFISAKNKQERRIKKAENPWLFFTIGFCIMIIGILIFGCPTRLILRSGYGDVYAIAAVAAMFTGIWVGIKVKFFCMRPRGRARLKGVLTMTDKMTKWLLLLIAAGLFLNAAALFYNSLVPNAYASGERIYLEGGKINVTLDRPVELRVDRKIPVDVDGEIKVGGFGAYGDALRVTVVDPVNVRQ